MRASQIVLSWDAIWSCLWPPKLRLLGTTFINKKLLQSKKEKNYLLQLSKFDKEKIDYFLDWINFLLMNVVPSGLNFGGQRQLQITSQLYYLTTGPT